jgi:hypothetical protein
MFVRLIEVNQMKTLSRHLQGGFFRQNILNKALRMKITLKTVDGDIVQNLECSCRH